MLSEEQIKSAAESDYMNEEQLAFFKQLLLDLYESTSTRIQQAKQQIAKPLDAADENDRATWEEQNSVSMRIFEREQRLLPKINQSLKRIKAGDYGYCLESGEPIGIARLLIRPTAEYCAEVKAIQETKEKFYKD